MLTLPSLCNFGELHSKKGGKNRLVKGQRYCICVWETYPSAEHSLCLIASEHCSIEHLFLHTSVVLVVVVVVDGGGVVQLAVSG